jgi:hypothetical protein
MRMPRLWLRKLTSIGAVAEGDNPEAQILLYKAKGEKRDFSTDQREDMAGRGVAMPDGSYPIPDKDALRRAIQSFGRAKNPAAVRAHIIRRARALGATDMLPEDWQQKGADIVETEELEKQDAVVEEAAEAAVEEPEADEISKRISEAEEEIAKARDERDAALQALADEVAKRRHTDFTARAKRLEPLLGPAEDTCDVLDVLEAKEPDAFAELEKRLEAALERVRLSDEIGTAGDEGADPVSRRDAWVRKYVLDHPDVPEYKARALYWKANPEALEAQREEQV